MSLKNCTSRIRSPALDRRTSSITFCASKPPRSDRDDWRRGERCSRAGGRQRIDCSGPQHGIARTSADAILLTDRLHGVVEAVDAAERTLTVIRQNLVWAFAYNFAALPLAALGYVTPLVAGVGMALSSLLVVANALRLTRPARTLQDNRRRGE